MPIHDQSYRRYQGQRIPPGSAWSVITRTGVKTMLSARRFLLVLVFAWAQFFVLAVITYLAANFPQADFLAPSPAMFRDFLGRQGFFAFVVTVYVGAGIIANDRRANALQIYLAKPLTRVEYVAGKLGILATFLLFVTWVPAVLLLGLQTMFTGSVAFVREHAFLVPAMTVYAALLVLVASFTMLALSSLSTSPRYVGIMYAGALILTDAVFGTLRAATGRSDLSWLSIGANLNQVGDVIFRIEPRYDTPWPISLLALLVVVIASIWVLERRIRGVEIIT